MFSKKNEVRAIFVAIVVFFGFFLIAPLGMLLASSLRDGSGTGLGNYMSVIGDGEILSSIGNSLKVSLATASITTVTAFILAYTVNSTKLLKPVKNFIRIGISIPMLLPTITYGFAIIYSFGKQGLITKLFGMEIVQIYGFNGLLIGYVVYTLPSAFLLINNSFGYIDKKFIIVSKLMGDGNFRSFVNTILRPLVGTLGGAFVLSFILSFTDFGIPASVGGTYNVVATHLYEVMLGSIPDFENGSVIAVLMLMPAAFGILFLNYIERFDFHYDKITKSELIRNPIRDGVLGVLSLTVVAAVISIFLVMFIAPFVKNYPYDMSFTSEIFTGTILNKSILDVFENSLLVAVVSAAVGTLIAYGAALVNARTTISKASKMSIDSFSMMTNTVPGMVLGLSYLMFFNGSSIKGTFAILIICNIIHFFTTPYLMAKNSLTKMNRAWETTGELLGDTWLRTVARVVVPNSMSTIIDMFGYYFISSMVTISAIIFLVTARTSIITSKIKELQHFGNFNEIFVLSILIFATNIAVKAGCDLANRKLSVHQ